MRTAAPSAPTSSVQVGLELVQEHLELRILEVADARNVGRIDDDRAGLFIAAMASVPARSAPSL